MRLSIPLTLSAALLIPAVPASADLITLEPDSFAAGADVSHASPGVTLWSLTATSSLDSPLMLSPVYARNNPACASNPFACDAVTGSQGFSPYSDGDGRLFGNWNGSRSVGHCFADVHTGALGGSSYNSCADAGNQRALLIQFDAPTDFVEIAGAWSHDFPMMVAFDANFHVVPVSDLGTWLPRLGEYHQNVLSITSSTSNISYVLAGSVGDATSLDALRYQSVPEPSTLALGAIGLVALFRARTRRRRDVIRPAQE